MLTIQSHLTCQSPANSEDNLREGRVSGEGTVGLEGVGGGAVCEGGTQHVECTPCSTL